MLSVGDILRQEREKQGLTLQQVEKTTKMRAKFLHAIETNDWDFFESKVYISGVIKSYAKFLGLDPKKTSAYFRRDYEKKEVVKFQKRIEPSNFQAQPKRIIIGIFVSVFLLFFAYFGYQLKIYFTPPKIAIVAPTKNIFRNVDRIKIEGKTEKEAGITIFGDKVFPNREGEFVYDFPLKKGKNQITIEVTGANGRKSTITKEYILE
jgi:cytoskeletal protein RodZ